MISIVMAAKNYAKYLPEAVESVFSQTHAHWELVIIDDGSTDSTSEAAQPYLADERVRYVKSDKLGQSRAKNLGARLSKGEYIAYLDADDAWEPTKLEKQLKLFANPAVGVVFSGRTLIDSEGTVTGTPPLDFPRGYILKDIFARNFICFSSVMLRREVFDQVGGFDTNLDLAIDYDLWLRAARHWEFDFVPEPLVRYRTGHGNLSAKLSDRVATALAIMNRAVFRPGLRRELPRGVLGEGYASTCRALAYVLRPSEPATAARWYLRALAWPGKRRDALKGLVACALRWLSNRRTPTSPFNASANA